MAFKIGSDIVIKNNTEIKGNQINYQRGKSQIIFPTSDRIQFQLNLSSGNHFVIDPSVVPSTDRDGTASSGSGQADNIEIVHGLNPSSKDLHTDGDINTPTIYYLYNVPYGGRSGTGNVKYQSRETLSYTLRQQVSAYEFTVLWKNFDDNVNSWYNAWSVIPYGFEDGSVSPTCSGLGIKRGTDVVFRFTLKPRAYTYSSQIHETFAVFTKLKDCYVI